MPFNLIADPWLPVRRLSGGREWIAPSGLTSHFTDDPIVALDFPRPDWNAAVTELLIGLLATVMAPEDTTAWADLWETPPTPEALAEKLATVRFAFNLDGDGPRCFQDFDPLSNLELKPVAALLIDAAGEKHCFSMDKALAALKAHECRIQSGPVTMTEGPSAGLQWLYFQAPWGQQLELVSYPGGITAYRERRLDVWRPR